MKFKEFVNWCNERACDGCWGMLEAIACINLRALPGMLHGMPGRSGRGNQKITKQRIKLESRYLPALF